MFNKKNEFRIITIEFQYIKFLKSLIEKKENKKNRRKYRNLILAQRQKKI